MDETNKLVEQAQHAIEASSKTSPTGAGPDRRGREGATEDHIDALNEAFALFRINYHNQYYKAYGDTQVLNQIKKLWLDSLADFSPETIRRGARRVIEDSEFLPTLNRMLRACQGAPEDWGLPDTHSAYVEACRAASPKAAQRWSHPAVYHAGLASDWFFLAGSPEKVAFPVFERHYRRLCEQVMAGRELPRPQAPALADDTETPLSPEENRQRMARLRRELDL